MFWVELLSWYYLSEEETTAFDILFCWIKTSNLVRNSIYVQKAWLWKSFLLADMIYKVDRTWEQMYMNSQKASKHLIMVEIMLKIDSWL